MKRQKLWLFSLFVVLLALSLTPTLAQNGETVISIAVPELMKDTFQTIINQFESENPGIQVEIRTVPGFEPPLYPMEAIDDYLDAVETYVSSADVVFVNTEALTPEATTAGYFLDLAPLVSTDTAINPADFYESLWRSFQWDRGMWALPVSGEASLLFYDPAAFDAAGLPYPNENWTLTDLANAIRALTQLDADGKVAVPGFMNYGRGIEALLVSLLETSLVDETTTPTSPVFDNPQLEELLTTWANLAAEGVLDVPENVMMTPDNRPPLFLGSSFMGQVNGPDEKPMSGALLPGGRAGVSASGFGISSGTIYPDAAYALVKFLTGRPETAGAFFGVSAQKNLPEPMTTEGPRFAMPAGATSPEMQALLDTALTNGISVSETRYAPYLETAFELMRGSGLEARDALQQVEAEILDRQAAAVARRDTVQVSVTPPVAAPELPPGEIALKFGATASISPFPNQEAWEQAMADFAANDPEVGYVELETSFLKSFDEMAATNDCFYVPNNEVQQADLSQVLSLGPLLDSDPTFSQEDIIGSSLAAVTRDGQIWALPMTLQPMAMRYNPDLFSAAGAVMPEKGWTVDEFESALRSLQAVTGDTPPFQMRAPGSSYLLLLIAAYGGLPFDYRTEPPTVNFTDPATVNAIREVLDLGREGLTDYQALASLGRSFAIGKGEDAPPAVSMELISGFGLAGMAIVSSGPMPEMPQEKALLTTFPQGTTYTAVSYDLSTAYISAQTQHAEACYRLLNYLVQKPDLFPSMPARRSLLNSPELAASQSEDSVNFYQQLDSLLSQPNTINIPTSGIGDFLQSYWLNRAFDRYVLEDADLETELAQAEQFTRDYQACIVAVPPFDPTANDIKAQEYFEQANACAKQVDPSFEG